MTAFEV
ncbi:hypothetical protein D046_3352A, partial [Vibrio parahaemolyticus V-223/04]